MFSETRDDGVPFDVVDGGVFDNIPIARALEAIQDSPASTPTARTLVYLDPSPPLLGALPAERTSTGTGFLPVVLRALPTARSAAGAASGEPRTGGDAAGYTPGPGKTVEASTARAVLVDALDSTVIAKLWESGSLDNVSYDHFSGYSAPVTAQLTGLRVAHGVARRAGVVGLDDEDARLAHAPPCAVPARESMIGSSSAL